MGKTAQRLTEVLTIRVTSEEATRLEKLAEREDRTFSDMARRVLGAGLKACEKVTR